MQNRYYIVVIAESATTIRLLVGSDAANPSHSNGEGLGCLMVFFGRSPEEWKPVH